MIKYVEGDLLSANAQALVNTVNTVGVMGKGIALQFKERFPGNLHVYILACKKGELSPGKMLVVKERTILGEDKIIINFPTKKDWKHKSKYEYIESGLQDLVRVIRQYEISSIAIPPLGCGNGGLDWNVVKSLMEKYLKELDGVEILIFAPNNAVKEILKKQESSHNTQLTPARALLLYALFYYESLGEYSSLFAANKLAYLFQRLGESSFKTLKFQAHHYGPYSPQLAHLMYSLNGKYIKGMEQMSVSAFETIELQYDTMSEVSRYVKTQLNSSQIDKLKRLISLIDGFQSTLSLEVLTSVDYIRKEHPNISKDDTIKAIQQWSDRKKKLFKEKYIEIAYDHLEEYARRR
jgi:O-acetyl-ADP-ribose deacetylase (regulator of RNase III)/uncharacterized protein YwgA